MCTSLYLTHTQDKSPNSSSQNRRLFPGFGPALTIRKNLLYSAELLQCRLNGSNTNAEPPPSPPHRTSKLLKCFARVKRTPLFAVVRYLAFCSMLHYFQLHTSCCYVSFTSYLTRFSQFAGSTNKVHNFGIIFWKFPVVRPFPLHYHTNIWQFEIEK